MAKRKKSTFERLSRGGLNRKQRRDLDRGAAKFEQRRTEWELKSLTSKALAKGFKLVPIPTAS